MKWHNSRFDILIYASCDYLVFCYFAVSAVVLHGYPSAGYDRKDLKYLPFDLPMPSGCHQSPGQSLYCWLRWLVDGITSISGVFEIWRSSSVFQCVLLSDDGCCTTHHHHHQVWLCTNMMMISRDMMQFLSIPTIRNLLVSFYDRKVSKDTP